MEYKYLRCNQNYQQKLDEKLKGWFFNTYNINRFILLLQKGVYLYEYMDDWEKMWWNIITWKRRFLQSLNYGRY